MTVGGYDFVAEEKQASPKPATVEGFTALIERRADYPEPHFVFLASDINPEHG